MENNVDAKLEYLYFIDTKTHYDKRDKFNNYLKENILVRVPIVKETRQSYYVPKGNFYNSAEEFEKKYQTDFSNCYLVNKKTMMAKISDYGITHQMYYQHPFLAKESYFVSANSYKIAEELKKCKNPSLLRQIAHNLEMEGLKELTYDFENKREEE